MQLVSVNISKEKGTSKQPVEAAEVTATGIAGDAHAGHWHRQVSLLSEELIATFAADAGRVIDPGAFGENLVTRGLALDQVCLLDRLTVGDAVELQVTQIGKECHGDACTIFREVGRCVMPHAGIFTRVLRGGSIHPGDAMRHHPHALCAHVITVSDRASRGAYEDHSGPRIRALLEAHLGGAKWRARITGGIVSDEPDDIRAALQTCLEQSIDVVFTTGGTGIGARDNTPEVIASLADKTIPGIMEHIRALYGAQKPAALLSRSVAAVAGRTLIYALPGSPRAVEEYMTEILKTLDHLLFTLSGIDRHG